MSLDKKVKECPGIRHHLFHKPTCVFNDESCNKYLHPHNCELYQSYVLPTLRIPRRSAIYGDK